MVNTKLDVHICGPTSVFHFDHPNEDDGLFTHGWGFHKSIERCPTDHRAVEPVSGRSGRRLAWLKSRRNPSEDFCINGLV